MASPVTLTALLILLFCLLVAWGRARPQASLLPTRLKVPRVPRPRTPDDCPHCRHPHSALPQPSPHPPPLRPWSEHKSRRGAPKRLSTAGFACPNPECLYAGNPDPKVHALVGYGHHGRHERIQDLHCQACGTKFSVRLNTPLYRLKTPSQRVGEVLTALAEGLDIGAAVRVFGHGEGTLRAWLTRAGLHAEDLHCHTLRDLALYHLQLDELRTTLRDKSHELWLWLAIDPTTKLIPVLVLGPRSLDVAYQVVHLLVHLLAPGCLPVFTSDGLDLYYYALTAHFGIWVKEAGKLKAHWQVPIYLLYAQVKKSYRRRRLTGVAVRERCGTREQIRARLQQWGFSGRINTAFIERVNLTLRHGIAALARRTWSTAQSAGELRLHLAWWRAYYHFVKPHAGLQFPSTSHRRRRTPAMAAGLTDHRWTVAEFLLYSSPPAPTCFTWGR